MAGQPRMIFVNLPVEDLAATQEFFAKLGFEFDKKFTDETAACMVINEHAYAMLIARSRFSGFTPKPIADANTSTEALIALSAESREAVDELVESALEAGGSPSGDPSDHGFMYERSFNDLDGHIWSVTWMDQAAIEQGPPTD